MIITKYIYITKINNWKCPITNNYFIVTEIYPDGNYFLHGVSKFLTREENYYLYLSNLCYNYINKNKEIILTNINNNLIYNNNVINTDKYIEK